MDVVEEPVQNLEKMVKRGRSQSERVGRLKYMLELLKRIEGEERMTIPTAAGPS